jgi:hypothetical protein
MSSPNNTRTPVERMPPAKPPAKRKPQRAGAGRTDASAKKGGGARQAGRAATGAKPEPVVLRIPKEVLDRVDRSVEARRAKNPIPRSTWLLEAVNEKLDREEADEYG